MLGSGHLILIVGGGEGDHRGRFVPRSLGEFFHASLANIFNRCHKKAVFMNNFEFGYIKYELEGRCTFLYKCTQGELIFSVCSHNGGL